MKKIISILLSLLIVILVISGLVTIYISSRSPDFLSVYLGNKLEVKVDVEDINIGSKGIKIENLEIGNIPTGLLNKAFSAQTIDIQFPLIYSLFRRSLFIDKIILDDVYLGLEFNSATSTKGNWTTLMSNLEKNANAESKVPNQKATATYITYKDCVIKELIINNITVDVLYLQSNSKVKRLPPIKQIVIKNIRASKGFPADQLTNSILGQLLKQVFIQENLKNMLDSVVNDPSQIQEIIQPFKDLFSK
ncbi:MAG: hypothetical protein FJZ57_02905 [Chlamydiae bacterium]|nr:hypothetical protein [Chlamydiota bacterium]